MVDSFISYARAEIERAKPINEALQGLGLTTFFDVEGLDGSDEFPDEIDLALRSAKCVIGVWSPYALTRPWVKKEARIAVHLKRLITVRIAPLVLEDHSTEFVGRHLSDLETFNGEIDHPGFLELLRAVAEKVERPSLTKLVHAAARAGSAAVASPIKAPSSGPNIPATSPSALAWAQISDSLDTEDYADFITHFPGSAELILAARHKRRLEAWAGVAKSDPEAIEAFLRDASFPALEAQARSAMQAALAARLAREKAEAEARQVAEAARLAAEEAARKAEKERREKPRRAAEAAKAGRPISERAFAIELPGVSNWPDPQMIAIPPGRFLMGAPSSEEGSSDLERPQHEVNIAYAFAMGQHTVTFAEWDAALADGAKLHKPGDQGWGRGNRPVINVSWEDAQAYLAWLNERCGAAAPGPYRLPSEAEWEYACRAGTDTPFSFGETISTDQANYDGDYTYGAGKKGEYRYKTMPVGSFPANEFGLHDMHGNVWEWVEDCYTDYRKTPKDGSANTTMGCSNRVIRGGSWYSNPVNIRSASRGRYTPTNRSNNLGLRVARTLLSGDY